MKHKALFIGGLATIVFIISFFITLAIAAPTDLSPQSTHASCNTLHYNGPNAFNLLFIASEAQTKEYANYFLEGAPYNRHKEQFNVFYLDKLDTKSFCKSYKGIASLCYSDELLKAAAACPHNAIVVLVDEPKNIRSSAYKNVLSINQNHPAQEVLRHELGHLYGLAEEYVPASLQRGQKNCQASCTEFERANADCFEGCSQASLYRSIEEGVMRTLARDQYGRYNEQLIETKLQELLEEQQQTITARAIDTQAACEEQTFHLIEVDTSEETWVVHDSQQLLGCPSGASATTYRAQLTDPTGTVVATTTFGDDLAFTDAPGTNEEIDGETYEEHRFWIELPASTNEATLTLFDEEGSERGTATLRSGENILCPL